MDRIQSFFPVFDDPPEDEETNVGDGKRGEHDIGIATRALKMRRRNPYHIFDPTAFITS